MPCSVSEEIYNNILYFKYTTIQIPNKYKKIYTSIKMLESHVKCCVHGEKEKRVYKNMLNTEMQRYEHILKFDSHTNIPKRSVSAAVMSASAEIFIPSHERKNMSMSI